jgi:Zinc carboxypeptidase
MSSFLTPKRSRFSAALFVSTVCGLCLPSYAGDLDGYQDNAELQLMLTDMASESQHVFVSVLGESLDGRPIHLITLSTNDSGKTKPALLITAGIDGRSLVSTETALRIAQQVTSEHQSILEEVTIYIIPRVNPDGAALNLEALTMGHVGNTRSLDSDRDRETGEDPNEDLNGDGYITMMRRLNPPIEDPPTHLADPDDPRLNIKPDPKEDQRATYTLYTEGIDNDGDGQLNEDGIGSVDLNKNFMHGWPEYDVDSGSYPLSEPESKLLADFVLSHDNIVMAYTLGQHDNLINIPDSKTKDITGRAPKGIDAKDLPMYERVAEFFKESTEQTNAPKTDHAGSFQSWLYAQKGIPSFASVVWGRPDVESPKGADSESDQGGSEPKEADAVDENAPKPSGIGDISQETVDELTAAYEAQTGETVDPAMAASVTPEMLEAFALELGIEIIRVNSQPDEEPASTPKKEKKIKLSEEGKWLNYFEQEAINGFVDWEPYDHPSLGAVEIGGFHALSRTNPPAAHLEVLGVQHTAFILELLEAKPIHEFVGPEIKPLSKGLYEIRFAIENNGLLPATSGYNSTNRGSKPIVVRLSTPVEQIVTGQRVSMSWNIQPNGTRWEHRWIVRSDDISSVSIEIIDPRFGKTTLQLGK